MTSHLLQYTLHLADNALILGHRNSEWTGHGPILEQDIALSNVALDLVGQSRNFYQYAADIKNDGTTEDDFAFLRNSSDFLNCLMVEQENGDWGKTMLRQYFMSAYMLPLYSTLKSSTDIRLAAIAEKSHKEVTYHLRWSSEWVIRLGQGTQEGNRRMNNALDALWQYTRELYTPAIFEASLAESKVAADMKTVEIEWNNSINAILPRAGLKVPKDPAISTGGKEGKHTIHLDQLLQEMQYMQRIYPGMEW